MVPEIVGEQWYLTNVIISLLTNIVEYRPSFRFNSSGVRLLNASVTTTYNSVKLRALSFAIVAWPLLLWVPEMREHTYLTSFPKFKICYVDNGNANTLVDAWTDSYVRNSIMTDYIALVKLLLMKLLYLSVFDPNCMVLGDTNISHFKRSCNCLDRNVYH